MTHRSIAESIQIIDDYIEEEIALQVVADEHNPEMVYEEMPVNWLGNLEVSLFWEEKIILMIKFLQMYGFVLSVYYETYPFKYQNELGDVLFFMSADFLHVGRGPLHWYQVI